MLQTYYIYEITNKINSKNYVGKRSCPLNETPWSDVHYMGGGICICRAEKKYGIENFSKYILAICYNENVLNILEKEYIDFYKSRGKAEYNIAEGGDGGNTYKYMSEERLNEVKQKKFLNP